MELREARRGAKVEIARVLLALATGAALLGSCAGHGPRAPWPGPSGHDDEGHAYVRTLNPGYRRAGAKVLVRQIDRPTRANLDYAAYAANFMIADAPPEGPQGNLPAVAGASPFGGVLVADSLTGSIRKTPLSEEERKAPLALAPLAEWLSSRAPKLATGLEDLIAGVREEAWGQGAGPLARQSAVLAYLHDAGTGHPPELYVKVEFQPWWRGFADLSDEDGDGVPEIYGRARDGTLATPAIALISTDYVNKVLDAGEVTSWAHKLASYWYPSYNTDLVAPGPKWPDADTEADVREALGGKTFDAPTVIVRGKPEGKPTYNVFLVAGQGAAADKPRAPAVKLSRGHATPQPQAVAHAIAAELADVGHGSWKAWQSHLAGFQADARKRVRALPAAVKGLPGEDGFLFYRNGVEYLTGGDLEKQKKGKNPLPIIIEWKKLLEDNGVDFLFVPVPDKSEIFPDKLVPGAASAALVGQVVNPFARKLLADLAAAGVETVDLWPAFLTDRKREPGAKEPLFQRQDTHWTPRGLAIAAHLVGERIKQYPWYGELGAKPKRYSEKPAPFQRYGDLHSRLRDAEKKRYQPEALVGQQVVGEGGALYEDDPDSTIVVLGDSFTGVLELTDCEHAGVSAHIAREIGAPVDLVMSYGGGPNVRHKLMRRGVEGLQSKRLVVWMMTARDLYNYWENWEPLGKK